MLRLTTVLDTLLRKCNETIGLLRPYRSHYESVIQRKDEHLIIHRAQIYHNPINIKANYYISASTQNGYHINIKTFKDWR